jgi:hypothetical protein
MGVSQTYGKVAIPSVGEDEPVFILRAQDRLAESAIQMYRLLAEAHGCQVSDTLSEEIASFREWRGQRRLPQGDGRGIGVACGVVAAGISGRRLNAKATR